MQKLVSERDQGPLCTDRCKLASERDYASPKELAAAYKRSNAHADALTAQYDSAHSTEALLTAPYGVSRWQALKALFWRERCAPDHTTCLLTLIGGQQQRSEYGWRSFSDAPSGDIEAENVLCESGLLISSVQACLLLQAAAEGVSKGAACPLGSAAAESVCDRVHLLRRPREDRHLARGAFPNGYNVQSFQRVRTCLFRGSELGDRMHWVVHCATMVRLLARCCDSCCSRKALI